MLGVSIKIKISSESEPVCQLGSVSDFETSRYIRRKLYEKKSKFKVDNDIIAICYDDLYIANFRNETSGIVCFQEKHSFLSIIRHEFPNTSVVIILSLFIFNFLKDYKLIFFANADMFFIILFFSILYLLFVWIKVNKRVAKNNCLLLSTK